MRTTIAPKRSVYLFFRVRSFRRTHFGGARLVVRYVNVRQVLTVIAAPFFVRAAMSRRSRQSSNLLGALDLGGRDRRVNH